MEQMDRKEKIEIEPVAVVFEEDHQAHINQETEIIETDYPEVQVHSDDQITVEILHLTRTTPNPHNFSRNPMLNDLPPITNPTIPPMLQTRVKHNVMVAENMDTTKTNARAQRKQVRRHQIEDPLEIEDHSETEVHSETEDVEDQPHQETIVVYQRK